MTNSDTVGMITNTLTRHKQNAIDNRPIQAIKLAMKRHTDFAIVFHNLCRLSPATATILREMLFLRHNHPNETALAALHLILIHRLNIIGFQ
ncbi:MAG: hypothetical protein ACR2IJ_05910 [Fluviibacter sp.]